MRGNHRLHAPASLSQRHHVEERGGYRLNTSISHRLGEQWEPRHLCPHETGGLTPVASITTFDEIFRHYSPCPWSLPVVFMFTLIPVIDGTLPGDVIWVRHGIADDSPVQSGVLVGMTGNRSGSIADCDREWSKVGLRRGALMPLWMSSC